MSGATPDLWRLAAQLRSPSRVAWRQLCQAADAAPVGWWTDEVIERLQHALVGFPDRYRLLPGRWMRQIFEGGAPPALELVRSIDLVLFADAPRVSPHAWIGCPGLRHVRILRLHDEQMGDEGALLLAGAPFPTGLDELALATGITSRGVSALAASPRLEGLSTLDLGRNQLSAEGLRALASSSHLRRLRTLHLGRNVLDDACVDALAGGALRGLRKLDLDCTHLTGAGLRRLCASGLLDGVGELNLSNNAIGQEGCEALAGCPGLGSLEVLFLHGCGLRDIDVAALLASTHLRGLHNLALSDNGLSMVTVEALARCPSLDRLRELDICHNAFPGEEASARLRQAPTLRGMGRLCV